MYGTELLQQNYYEDNRIVLHWESSSLSLLKTRMLTHTITARTMHVVCVSLPITCTLADQISRSFVWKYASCYNRITTKITGSRCTGKVKFPFGSLSLLKTRMLTHTITTRTMHVVCMSLPTTCTLVDRISRSFVRK
jgi:hypothetical protein